MATVVQGLAIENSATGQTSFGSGFTGATTSGNLLVAFYGARDDGNDADPNFTLASGWTKIGETTPAEFHRAGMAWRVADGSATDDGFTVTPTTGTVRASWVGVVEFNQASVSDWELDAFSFLGAGATNVSSIASGSTGTLSSAVGVAAIVGTSRTASEGLTTDTGTSLSGTNAKFEIDAGEANFIAAWLSLTATTALNATISESNGASRMGAGIAVFVEASGATNAEATPAVVSAAGELPAPTVSTGTVPAAVDDLAGTAADESVVLTWTAPDDGGATITDYVVEWREVP